MPASTFISVDLPAPFSPTMARTSPALMLTETSSRACTPGKCLRICSASTTGGAMPRSLLAQKAFELGLEVGSLDLPLAAILRDDAVRHVADAIGWQEGSVST